MKPDRYRTKFLSILLVLVTGGIAGPTIAQLKSIPCYEETIEITKNQQKLYRHLYRMGSYWRVELFEGLLKKNPDAIHFLHLVPDGLRWTYQVFPPFRPNKPPSRSADVWDEIKWLAFWKEVKQKGFDVVMNENHIPKVLQFEFQKGQVLSLEHIEQDLQQTRNVYLHFPYSPLHFSKQVLQGFGKPTGQEKLGNIVCKIYHQEQVEGNKRIAVDYWVEPKTGMVWQERRDRGETLGTSHDVVTYRLLAFHVYPALPMKLFLLPTGTYASLPQKVVEYLKDRYGLWSGVKVLVDKNYGGYGRPVNPPIVEAPLVPPY